MTYVTGLPIEKELGQAVTPGVIGCFQYKSGEIF
jgi:hypothetical protein